MRQLKFGNPAITEEFAASMARLGHPLPWDCQDGGIFDANSLLIGEVRGRDAESTLRLAAKIIIAMNTCGGFKAQITSDELADKDDQTDREIAELEVLAIRNRATD